MKKRITASLLAIMLTASLFAGCTTGGETPATPPTPPSSAAASTDSSAAGSEGTPAAATDEPSFEDIQFPDELPKQIVMAADGLYGYDDLTERYSIEIMLTGYGEEPLSPDKDPVNQWLSKQFNMDISLTAPVGDDYATLVSTRFAANDVPDVLMLSSVDRDMAFALSDQNLLVDAKHIYPYLSHSNQYTTQNMIKWSQNINGQIPFITKYAIQDGVWGYAIRSDWMNALNMTYPTTREALMAYAKAATFDDPDGNGQNDTYFITGGGNGVGWGMLDGFSTMFGNPSTHVKDGQLENQYFNGTRKEFLSFLKELYDAGVLAPDWYTMDWTKAHATMSTDRLGVVRWPVGALYQQYSLEDHSSSMESLEIWEYWGQTPIEGGKYDAVGNPGYLWAFTTAKFSEGGELNMGKIKRVAHMIDTMTIGNINFFSTIQGSNDEVFEAAGIAIETPRFTEYTSEGTFYVSNPNTAPYNQESGSKSIDIWQNFGLCVGYQVNYADPNDAYSSRYAERTGEYYKVVNQEYERWPNDALLVTLTADAAEAQSTNKDWILAQEYAFVTGARSLDEYDTFTQEWLNKGGKAIIQQSAEQLGVPVPDYAA